MALGTHLASRLLYLVTSGKPLGLSEATPLP